jgi:hypothetical protein
MILNIKVKETAVPINAVKTCPQTISMPWIVPKGKTKSRPSVRKFAGFPTNASIPKDVSASPTRFATWSKGTFPMAEGSRL